jgi:hypothetical protein
VTSAQVEHVLKLLKAGWPSMSDLPPETTILWARQLITMDYSVTMAAAESLTGTLKFFPSLAEFRGAVHNERQRRGEFQNTEDRIALTESPWPQSGKTAKEWVAEIREKLANAQPYRIDPKTGAKVMLPKSVPGFARLGETLAAKEGEVA